MILDTMSSTWRFQQVYKASQLTKQQKTATLKMKRKQIQHKYKRVLHKLAYATDATKLLAPVVQKVNNAMDKSLTSG